MSEKQLPRRKKLGRSQSLPKKEGGCRQARAVMSLSGGPAVSAKRRRVAITAGEKRDICKWHQEHPQVSMGGLLSWVQKTLCMDLPKSTLSDILREAPKWLEVTPEKEHLTRARCGSQGQLETALLAWLSELGTNNAAVSDVALVDKARILGGSLGEVPQFAVCLTAVTRPPVLAHGSFH